MANKRRGKSFGGVTEERLVVGIRSDSQRAARPGYTGTKSCSRRFPLTRHPGDFDSAILGRGDSSRLAEPKKLECWWITIS
jgi:hypothetical protein